MFRGMMGLPGGRESRWSNTETEVRIPLRQTLYAIAALVVVSFVFHRGVTLPITARLFGASTMLHPVQSALFLLSMRLSVVLPLLLYAYANMLNVVDPNWTPPRSAAPADIGPLAPGFLRWPLRWLAGKPEPPQNYNAPTSAEPVDHTITATLLWHPDANQRVTYKSTVSLAVSEWEMLGRIAAAHKNFSTRDLHAAGFRSPRDRDVAKMLTDARLVVQGSGNAKIPDESFRYWLENDGWLAPSPKDGAGATANRVVTAK